ncbi:hypothetical protein FM105_02515 [Brevibacterium yomogidense]|uniref:Uncharacterized protein n=1 Tax=Brevibacterium yomogidense TaxID=946573 RepID=A0A1X6WZC6_9MICO|nr:hypothetical protein FM105_02515 [Brevibacterium yomogidense]
MSCHRSAGHARCAHSRLPHQEAEVSLSDGLRPRSSHSSGNQSFPPLAVARTLSPRSQHGEAPTTRRHGDTPTRRPHGTAAPALLPRRRRGAPLRTRSGEAPYGAAAPVAADQAARSGAGDPAVRADHPPRGPHGGGPPASARSRPTTTEAAAGGPATASAAAPHPTTASDPEPTEAP